MRIRFLLLVICVIFTAILTEPTFVGSQQNDSPPPTETCNVTRMMKQKPEPAAAELCVCEQTSAVEKPTYETGVDSFGTKSVANKSSKSSKRRGKGVAAGPGTLDRIENTTLLGELAVPNKDDLSSSEVAGLQQQLLDYREKRRRATEDNWQQYQKFRLRGQTPEQALQQATNERSRQILAANILLYKQFKNLQNTGDWHLLPDFDWRNRGLDVGRVMQQGMCGSCWAFASVSVFQAAWDLEQVRTGDALLRQIVPGNSYFKRRPSVQQLLNCLGKTKGDCTDGWHGAAFAFMVNSHVPHIPDRLVFDKEESNFIEPYTGRLSVCTDPLRNKRVKRGGFQVVPMIGGEGEGGLLKNSDLILTAQDRALAWGYVNEPFDKMPSVEQLKVALVKYGPLAAPMWADNCFSVYKSGIFNANNNRTVNHVVMLIGWDDAKQAWLIKNSWSEAWGESGFAWIKYNSNNIGLFAAWIQPSPINEEMP